MSAINTRDLVMLASQTLTTNGSGPDLNLAQAYQAAIFSISASTVTGTSPSFSFFIQTQLTPAATTDLVGNAPTGTPFHDDLLGFTAITTNGTSIARITTSPIGAGTPSTSGSLAVGMDYISKDATLTAGNYRLGSLGGMLRIKWTVSGTSPSGVFSVQAHFVPYAT